jgi:hypothetical protein
MEYINNIDTIFECELNLAMVKAGYEILHSNIINNYKTIISSEIYKNDDRINRLKIEFSKTLNKIDFHYDELKKTKGFKEERCDWGIKQIS